MRPVFLTIGLLTVLFSGYPPFSLTGVFIGLGLVLFGIYGDKREKK